MKRLIALLSALALFAAACSGNDASTDETSDDPSTDGTTAGGEGSEGNTDGDGAPSVEAGSGGNLLMLQWQAPSQANALLSNGEKDLLASSLVLEPLAEFAPDGGLIPALAAEIPTADNGGISEDLMSVTWTLRDDVLWSDGTPFTADDVVFSWEYCADENTGCSLEVFTDVTSVVADDDHTVTVNFTDAKPYPFEAFVSWQSPVIQRAQFADCIGAAAKACADQNFSPVGTGPYVVTELRPEDTVTFEMNPNYRGIADGKPFFGTVEIKGGGDAEASARSVLEIGEADYAWNLQVAPEVIGPMEAAGNGRIQSAFTADVEHLNLNQTDPNSDPPSEGSNNPLFLDNPDLHRALSIAIDRDELVDIGYGPSGNATCNIWPVGAENSTNSDWCLTQDIEAANALLDGLGYEDTDGDGVREADGVPLEFDMVTSTNAVRQSNQELIKSYWVEIGVVANIKNEDPSLFFDGTCASDACIWKFFTDIQMFTNSASSPNAASYLNSWESTKIPTSETSWGGDNIPRLNSDEFDTMSAELQLMPLTDPARVGVVIALNDILSTTATIPLIHRASVSAFANSIQGTGDLNGWDSEYYNIEDWFRSE